MNDMGSDLPAQFVAIARSQSGCRLEMRLGRITFGLLSHVELRDRRIPKTTVSHSTSSISNCLVSSLNGAETIHSELNSLRFC